jgi:hypothetical protein
MNSKKYLCGVDLSTTGCIAITDGNKIIDVFKYPKEEYDTKKYNALTNQIKQLKDELKSKTKIRYLKAERKALKRKSKRDYSTIYEFLNKYKNDISVVIMEEPLRQMAFGSTSSDTLCSNHITLGVCLAILSILELDYKLYMPKEWHQQFPFEFNGKLPQKERRAKIKEQSIQFTKERFSNADDFLIKKGCTKEDDNIAEACLLSLLGIEV